MEEIKEVIAQEEVDQVVQVVQVIPEVKKKRDKRLNKTTTYRRNKKFAGRLNFPQQLKERPLTIKEMAVAEAILEGKEPRPSIGLRIYNTSPKNASQVVSAVLARPEVKNYIEKRLAVNQIDINKHLKNIDNLAFTAEKEDIRLRASQDLADRSGFHYKYYADDGKVQIEKDISDEEFSQIISKYKPL